MNPVRLLRELASPERVATLAKDTAYVGIGFAVLTYQRAQVLRRELERVVPTRGR